VRLTADGVRVLVASAGLFAAGLWLGWPVAELVAGAGVGAVGFAVVTAGRGLRVDVEREIYPERVVRGEPAVARLRVRNAGARRSGAFEAHDAAGERRLSVSVPTLGIGEVVQRTYRLPTDRRGRHVVGPLTLTRQDALGLVRTQVATGGTATLWVHPRSHTLKVGDVGVSRRFDGRTVDQRSRGSLVFHALREYAVGDDLRHVHWKSTARRDELMVRQDEMPWQGRATVLLDTRADAHTTETFERAVSAAASIVVACSRRRFLLRLVTTGGDDSGMGAGAGHIDGILERLATVALDRSGHLAGAASSLRRAGAGGGAISVLLGGRGEDLDTVSRLRRSFAHCTALSFRDTPGGPVAGGLFIVDDDHLFPAVWPLALGRRRSLAARR
jgi:uncharacterized protein (DUF58 family)